MGTIRAETVTPDRRHLRVVTAVVGLALLLGVGSLALGLANTISNQHLQDQRAADRITADLAGCARGNDFRSQVRDLGKAAEQLDHDILSVFLPDVGDPRVAQLEQRLQPGFDNFDTSIAKVKSVDCDAVTPGATPSTSPAPSKENP